MPYLAVQIAAESTTLSPVSLCVRFVCILPVRVQAALRTKPSIDVSLCKVRSSHYLCIFCLPSSHPSFVPLTLSFDLSGVDVQQNSLLIKTAIELETTALKERRAFEAKQMQRHEETGLLDRQAEATGTRKQKQKQEQVRQHMNSTCTTYLTWSLRFAPSAQKEHGGKAPAQPRLGGCTTRAAGAPGRPVARAERVQPKPGQARDPAVPRTP